MITKTFDYWAIRTEDDDRSSSDKEFFDTFADAMAARMNYADWYTGEGICTIRHYRIGPDYKTAVMVDEVSLCGSDRYRMWVYRGHVVISTDPNARGNISELPDLFRQGE